MALTLVGNTQLQEMPLQNHFGSQRCTDTQMMLSVNTAIALYNNIVLTPNMWASSMHG
jgi:hypothetical protein